jgi:hypothetical protein
MILRSRIEIDEYGFGGSLMLYYLWVHVKLSFWSGFMDSSGELCTVFLLAFERSFPILLL